MNNINVLNDKDHVCCKGDTSCDDCTCDENVICNEDDCNEIEMDADDVYPTLKLNMILQVTASIADTIEDNMLSIQKYKAIFLKNAAENAPNEKLGEALLHIQNYNDKLLTQLKRLYSIDKCFSAEDV